MDIFTVSLFGHRRIDDLRKLNDRLTPIIKKLIKTKPYVAFLIWRNGEFDEYAASVIKFVQRELGKENNDITLVLPTTLTEIQTNAFSECLNLDTIVYSDTEEAWHSVVKGTGYIDGGIVITLRSYDKTLKIRGQQ